MRMRKWQMATVVAGLLAVCGGMSPSSASAGPAALQRSRWASGKGTSVDGTSVDGLVVSVGYAEDKENNTPNPASFPVPWMGAPNTIFLGNPVPGNNVCGNVTKCYDTGAIRLDNPTASPIDVTQVSVDDHSSVPGGTVFNNLWGSFEVPPGESVILAANPPFNDPKHDNFDTSSWPPNQCTPISVAPTVSITIGTTTTTLADSAHVLDTGGIDAGYCGQNESIQWHLIGVAGTKVASLSLRPRITTAATGSTVTVTATLLDGTGAPLPNVRIAFRVRGGPDAGRFATAFTNSVGQASFSLVGPNPGKDTLVARVRTVGSFRSNVAYVTWTSAA